MARFLICASAALAIALPGASSARPRDAKATGLKTLSYTKVPPDFTFDTGGGPEKLSALRGRPVVLNFWATWCPPCTDELGVFEKLHEAYGDSIALVTLAAEPKGVARTYLESKGFQQLPLVEDPLRQVHDAYSIARIPVTVVLKADGTVSWVWIGEVMGPELRAAVDAAGGTPGREGVKAL
jgi:thiol-disulfide isomerase/thioredoxin